MRRRWSLILAILLTVAVLGGCSSKAKMDSKPAERAGSTASAPMADSAKPMAPASGAPQAAPAPAASNGPASTPIVPAPDRKIIQNGSFDIKIKDGDATVNKISASVTASGGYVQDVKQSGTKQSGRTINMTVRVPYGQYAAITELVRGLGDVTQQHQWTEDVTEQFVDVEERIKASQTHLDQLNKLYTQGGTIKDMMEVENEINRVTADLESMKGRLRVLSNRVDFSTIVINLYEPGVVAPIEPPKTVWERVTRGFTDSWHGVVNFTGDLVVFLATALPVLVYLAIIAAILFFVGRPLWKRYYKK